MNDDERTILDPQYTEGNSQNNNSAAQPQQPTQPSQQQSKDKNMGWGEKAAYAAGGAVFGAGMTLAGQAMAAPSAEMPADAPLVPESEDKKDEEVAAPESATVSEGTPETKVTVDEVSGVTVESAGTTVHVTGNADVDVNNGNVHVTAGAAVPHDQAASQQQAPNPTQPAYHRTTVHQESYDHQGPAPDPEDAIVATATGVRVAQVDDSASFSQAFADARAQVGPGGIFEWHGRVYATYYKEEWDHMSAAERHEFQANIDYNDVLTDDSMAQHHNDMAHNNTHTQGHHVSHEPQHTSNQEPQHNDNYQQVNDDNEVHVLDVAQTDLNEDGIPEDAALLEVNGHEIIIVDIDCDGIADVAIADVDGDGNPEFGDLSGEGIGMPSMDSGDMYLAQNDGPDYMNDADVGNYMA